MAPFTFTTLATFIYLTFLIPSSYSSPINAANHCSFPEGDIELLEFPLNLEYLEAEFFLYGALGYGLDKAAPHLTMGGASPIGATKANLDFFARDVIEQFAWQEVGHVRAIQKTIKGFPRPLLDLSAKTFATIMEKAIGKPLSPPFDPYANALNFLLASYVIPYVGLTGYVGTNPKLNGTASKQLVAGLLAVESGQDAVIRALLYEHAMVKVHPYDITVAEFTNSISSLRNKLGNAGVRDEGLVVHRKLGAEEQVKGNILAGDKYSLGYGRTPEEILKIVYGSGDEHTPGGFYPKGADGAIAKKYLDKNTFTEQ